jgi:hypothetical protein
VQKVDALVQKQEEVAVQLDALGRQQVGLLPLTAKVNDSKYQLNKGNNDKGYTEVKINNDKGYTEVKI